MLEECAERKRYYVVNTDIANEQLMISVSEQLKLPLMQVARRAEAAELRGTTQDFAAIRVTAQSALQLLDNFLLSLRLQNGYLQLELEPVSVSSVLYDAGQAVRGLADQYGVELQVDIGGRYGPVTANRMALEAALISLASTLIEGLPGMDLPAPQLELQFATHRCRYGIVAGVYMRHKSLKPESLDKGLSLHGKARQPFNVLTHASGAGIFVADTIVKAMQLQLKVSRHNGWRGIGVVMAPNQQLQLI